MPSELGPGPTVPALADAIFSALRRVLRNCSACVMFLTNFVDPASVGVKRLFILSHTHMHLCSLSNSVSPLSPVLPQGEHVGLEGIWG